MKRIRIFLTPSRQREDGFTLIEVMVAMMVFAIISVGIAYSLTTTLTMTRDSRAREVASNLAAQQIDNVRSFEDVFSVTSATTTQTVDGTVYTIAQTTNWVSSTGAAATCGTAGGLLQAKAVNVSVSWPGERAGTSPVQANTMLAPSGPLNDPLMGTILVHVVNAAGSGVQGIAVAAAPDKSVSGNTAQSVSPSPSATDADGCSYVLKVTPGSYVITIGTSGDGYIGSTQATTPNKPIQVKANDSVTAEFVYDRAASVTLQYTSTASLTGAMFPSPLDVSMASVNAIDNASVTASGAAPSSTVSVFPYPGGYAFFAGNSQAPNGETPGCMSVDPGNWTTPNAAGQVGVRPAITVTSAGGVSPPASVPLGVVTVKNLSGKYLTAVSATADASVGDPGCTTGMTYKFAKASSNSASVVLPFGTWTLYSGTSSGSTSSPISNSALGLPAGTPLTGTSIFTLDPRGVT